MFASFVEIHFLFVLEIFKQSGGGIVEETNRHQINVSRGGEGKGGSKQNIWRSTVPVSAKWGEDKTNFLVFFLSLADSRGGGKGTRPQNKKVYIL